MAFPETGVLDVFTDASAPRRLQVYDATNWAILSGIAAQGLQTETDGTVSRGAVSAASYWQTVSNEDVETYLDLTTTDTTGEVSLWGRVQNPTNSSTIVGYWLRVRLALNEWELRSRSGAGSTLIDSGAFTPASGDKFGLACVGDQISVYVNDGGAGWTALGSSPYTNTAVTGAGTIGVSIVTSNTVRLDNFGGGAITAGVTITGTLQTGQVLTADPDGFTPISYVWNRADDGSGTNLTVVGSTGSTYTVAAGDLDKYIRVGVVH